MDRSFRCTNLYTKIYGFYQKKSARTISEYRMVAGYKANTHKKLYFYMLSINNIKIEFSSN